MKIGKYEILGELGRGAMGMVLLGYDPTLDCKVAIKTVRTDSVDPNMRRQMETRLLREARAAARLDHPGIVPVREFIHEGDAGYIVMKLVQGRTLDHVSPLTQPADPGWVLRVLRDCAAALDHAHARNIVHRDIKPGNIMIDDETGAAQITDFGIAKILGGETSTEPGMVVGTIEYMAPEQLVPGPIDGRADQFSLAVVAYKMLTGAPMYTADTMRRLSYQITAVPPPSACQANPALPPEVDTVFATALSKDPAYRYGSCGDFVWALEMALGYAPPEAQPQEPSSQALNAVWIVIAMVALAAVVLVVGAVILHLQRREIARPPSEPTKTTSTVVPPSSTTPKPLAAFLNLPTGDMVLVDQGAALLGEPPRTMNVDAFYIDRTEVTNRAYLDFCHATEHATPPGADQAPAGNPVVNVSFDDAKLFAQWAGKRLPTAEEWEKAARGSQGRAFPWGNEWKSGIANIPQIKSDKGSVMPADALPDGASPYGALNMLGNVWEWVDKQDVPDNEGFRILSESKLARNLSPPLSRAEPMYQVRGGSYLYFLEDSQKRSLMWDALVLPARLAKSDVGFRCARNP